MAGGFLFHWYHQRNVPAKELPVVPAVEDPRAAIALFNARERERELQKDVDKFLESEDQSVAEVHAGVKHFLDLGLLYLKEKKFDDADKLFKKLSDPQRPNETYHRLGRLGHAIVLAFKDEYTASNNEFKLIMADFEKIEARGGARPFPKPNAPSKRDPTRQVDLEYRLLWKDNPKVREIVAKALNQNWANSKDEFPASKLDVYRFPPRPVLKPAPPPMPPPAP